MRDQRLKGYYTRELTFIRQLAEEFAEEYDGIAPSLRLNDEVGDPHVERLLQGFAFLAARIHLKVDDEFPEVAQDLLNAVYPQYLRPIPSCAIVEFGWDLAQGMTDPWPLPRGTSLASPPTADGVRCRFRTTFDTTLWPVEVTSAGWHSIHELDLPVATEATSALRIDLQTSPNTSFDELELTSLRWYLNGDLGLVSDLYELLFNNCIQVYALDPDGNRPPIALGAEAIRPVGYELEEALLPAPRRAFWGHRLLQEFFAFPRKHFFFDLDNLHRLRGQGFGESAQLVFLITPFQRREREARLKEGVNKGTLRLGCSPIVNLFETQARPIRVTQRTEEYPVTVQGDPEVFSVDNVFAVSAGSAKRITFTEFHDLRHSRRDNPGGAFWRGVRRPKAFRGSGSEISLAFVDLDGAATDPDCTTVGVRVTCSDGDLPSQLPWGSTEHDFYFEEMDAPISSIRALVTPTPSIAPPLGGAAYWRLISALSLNFISVVEEQSDAFRETMRLYNFSGSSVIDRIIHGISSVQSEPTYAPVQGEYGLSFARGRRVELTFDEDMFESVGVFLFASVLDRFLGMSASVNSFTALRANSTHREAPIREWPPRSGLRAVV